MCLEGTNIVFSTRTPSQYELETCRHVQLGSYYEWDPSVFAVSKTHLGSLHSFPGNLDQDEIASEGEIYNPDTFCRRLLASCKVSRMPYERRVHEVLTRCSQMYNPHLVLLRSREEQISPHNHCQISG